MATLGLRFFFNAFIRSSGSASFNVEDLSFSGDLSSDLFLFSFDFDLVFNRLGFSLFFKNDEKVKKNSKICEWDPYTTPVIAEKSGIVNFVDLIDGVSLSETLDETTGISSKSVIDWRSQSKNTDLKPCLLYTSPSPRDGLLSRMPSSA